MIRTASKLLLILMAGALCLSVAPATAQAGETDVYFSPNGGGAAATIDLIEAATDTIDVAMYSVHTHKKHEVVEGDTVDSIAEAWGMSPAKVRELNELDPGEEPEAGDRLKVQAPIFAALERAVDRGVRVRMILNKGHLSSNAYKARDLAGIGVHVFSQTKTVHQKFALFDALSDHAKLCNGSANWSMSADTRYSENTVVYRDHPNLIWQFQREFNLLLTQSNTRALSPGADQHQEPVALPQPATPQELWMERALFTSANILEDAESEDGVVADAIVEAIRSAERKIRVDVAHFDSRPIAEAIVWRRHNSIWKDKDGDGIKDLGEIFGPLSDIQVLLDQGELSGWAGQARYAEQNGVDIRYKTYSLEYLQPRSQLMHHKTVIIDDALLITGSYNFSHTAEFKNFENSVVIRGAENAELIAAFSAEHESLWDMGRDTFARFQQVLSATNPTSPDYRRFLPIHYDTPYFDQIMTLSRWEVDGYYWNVVRPLRITKGMRSRYFFDRVTKQAVDLDAAEIAALGHFLEGSPTPAPSTVQAGASADGSSGIVNQIPGGN